MSLFVYSWFDCLGKLVVLESGESPALPMYGKIVAYTTVVLGPELIFATNTIAIWVLILLRVCCPEQLYPQLYPESTNGFALKGTLFDDSNITNSIDANPVGNVRSNLVSFVGIDSKVYDISGKPSIKDSSHSMVTMFQTKFTDNKTVTLQVGTISNKTI